MQELDLDRPSIVVIMAIAKTFKDGGSEVSSEVTAVADFLEKTLASNPNQEIIKLHVGRSQLVAIKTILSLPIQEDPDPGEHPVVTATMQDFIRCRNRVIEVIDRLIIKAEYNVSHQSPFPQKVGLA